MKKTLLTLLAAMGLQAGAHAVILAYDNFDYPDGDLVDVSGGTWTTFSGTTDILVQDETALMSSSRSADDSISLGTTMGAGDAFYYGFDVSVSASTGTAYFALLKTTSASAFNARLWVMPFAGSDFTFGISATSSGQVTWTSGLTYGETYRVVVGYDYDSGDSTLWVNPVSEMSPSVTVNGVFSDAIVQFGLRQASGIGGEAIDGLVVATTFDEALTPVPEPQEYAVAVAGLLLALVVMRRRRAC